MVSLEKNIALILRGKSFESNYKHWDKKSYSIDWRKCLTNFQENIIPFCKHVYLNTNDHPLKEEVVESFKPVFSYFNNYNTPVYISLATQILSCLRKIVESNETYDLIVITRFDAFFEYPITELPIDPNKFNILCLAERPGLVDDNLWIFPYSMISKIIPLLENICNRKIHSTHEIITPLTHSIGSDNINIMFDGSFIIYYNRPYIKFLREISP